MVALLIALACVAANAFFVAAEFALVKVRPTALESLAAAGDRRAQLALESIKKLDAYLSATQLGITLASLGLGWVGEPAIAYYVGPVLVSLGVPESAIHPISLTLAFAVITLLHIVVGELAPKSLAIRHPERVAMLAASTMRVFYLVTYPFLYILNGTSNLLLRALGVEAPKHGSGAPSPEEIRLIVQASFRAGSLEGPQRNLMEQVLMGSRRTVKAVMVPRVDMSFIDVEDSVEDVQRAISENGFSRIPVCQGGDPDRTLGYIYAKDLWMAGPSTPTALADVRRDVLFFPEARTVAEALEDFRRTKIPIAIVVDEYGGTSGLVTLEDCVEEIVGDIQDETDDESSATLIRPDGTVVVDASLPFADLDVEELRGISDGDETVGAYVMERLGRIPRPGDHLQVGDFMVTVEVVSERRVSRVAFRAAETTGRFQALPKD